MRGTGEGALGQARQIVEQQADLCCQQIGIERLSGVLGMKGSRYVYIALSIRTSRISPHKSEEKLESNGRDRSLVSRDEVAAKAVWSLA